MKGLLIKDYRLLFGQKKVFIIIMMIWLMLFFTNEADGFTFVTSYMMFVMAIFTISTISYDQYDNGMTFLLTLPVTRTVYVQEKYLFAIMNAIAAALLSVLVTGVMGAVRGTMIDIGELFAITAGTGAIVLVMIAVMLPFSIIFGTEKGRLVMVAVAGICCVIGFVGSKLPKPSNLDAVWNQIFSQNPVYLILAGVVLCICILGISCLITISAMKKKEF